MRRRKFARLHPDDARWCVEHHGFVIAGRCSQGMIDPDRVPCVPVPMYLEVTEVREALT